MSTLIAVRGLPPDEMKACPVMNLWAMSELNGLKFLPGDRVSECWIDQKLAAYLFEKQTLKTARNGLLRGVRRHPKNSDMVLFGDLQGSKSPVKEDLPERRNGKPRDKAAAKVSKESLAIAIVGSTGVTDLTQIAEQLGCSRRTVERMTTLRTMIDNMKVVGTPNRGYRTAGGGVDGIA